MQALQLMNDIQHVEAARHFAARMISSGGDTAKSRIRWAWQVVSSRYPDDRELNIAVTALDEHTQRFRLDLEAAKQLTSYGDSDPAETIDPDQLAAYTMIANLLLNLDEVVTKN
jgi:hypothetical protein